MARRKPPPSRSSSSDSGSTESKASPPNDVSTGDVAASGGSSNEHRKKIDRGGAVENAAQMPSKAIRNLLSFLVVLHLVVLFVSFSAIIEPSSTQNSLLETLAPYLRSTHFAADGRRFYLAHATADEQPHRLQVAAANPRGPFEIDYQTKWTTVDPSGIPGLAASDRYAKWMALAATLSESDQRSLAAALLMPLVRSDKTIAAVRIVRLPTQLTTAEQDAAGPAYLARVVRDENQVSLVSIESKRLTTSSRQPEATP
ncbi:hypothetical protein LOC67_12345 [Stieleria sp. JC731]|uniref:hypothetical protein n=1 Tax=Pirellulaceae TaxID=2691357 RepID=UPI001E2A50AA|nr:hypothetical protein [Stieleria sp. JC731]MCC9601337.1 hypothetical protein [Stieleria sp. JC731]